MSNILSISAVELVEKLKSGEVSCVDVCKEYLKRVDKFEKDVKAWAFLDKKLLLEKLKKKMNTGNLENQWDHFMVCLLE